LRLNETVILHEIKFKLLILKAGEKKRKQNNCLNVFLTSSIEQKEKPCPQQRVFAPFCPRYPLEAMRAFRLRKETQSTISSEKDGIKMEFRVVRFFREQLLQVDKEEKRRSGRPPRFSWTEFSKSRSKPPTKVAT